MKLRFLFVALFFAWGVASAQVEIETQPDLTAEIKTLTSNHQKAVMEFTRAFRDVPRAERGEFVTTNYPKADPVIATLNTMIDANPNDPAMFRALKWIAGTTRGKGLEQKHYTNLEENYLHQEKIGEVALALTRSKLPEAQAFISTVIEKSESKNARGMAIYAQALGMEKDRSKVAEYAALSETLINDYPDLMVKGQNVATVLKEKKEAASKFEIGKVAPETIGKDVDGNEMKLSDYRGQVVLFDFWGDW